MVAQVFLNASHILNDKDELVSNPNTALRPTGIKHTSQVRFVFEEEQKKIDLKMHRMLYNRLQYFKGA